MLWSVDSCQNSISADQYRLTVSRAQVSPHWVPVLLETIRWQVITFQMIAGSSSIFLNACEISYVHELHHHILISNWPRTRKFSRLLHAVAFDFLTMVTRWSSCSSNFYSLIGQNLTGEFMQKMYATSWKLFTLTAKADRVVMFLTVFFLWMDKMSCCYQESSVIHGWFVYWVFGWEMRRQNSVIRFRMASFSFFTLLNV